MEEAEIGKENEQERGPPSIRPLAQKRQLRVKTPDTLLKYVLIQQAGNADKKNMSSVLQLPADLEDSTQDPYFIRTHQNIGKSRFSLDLPEEEKLEVEEEVTEEERERVNIVNIEDTNRDELNRVDIVNIEDINNDENNENIYIENIPKNTITNNNVEKKEEKEMEDSNVNKKVVKQEINSRIEIQPLNIPDNDLEMNYLANPPDHHREDNSEDVIDVIDVINVDVIEEEKIIDSIRDGGNDQMGEHVPEYSEASLEDIYILQGDPDNMEDIGGQGDIGGQEDIVIRIPTPPIDKENALDADGEDRYTQNTSIIEESKSLDPPPISVQIPMHLTIIPTTDLHSQSLETNLSVPTISDLSKLNINTQLLESKANKREDLMEAEVEAVGEEGKELQVPIPIYMQEISDSQGKLIGTGTHIVNIDSQGVTQNIVEDPVKEEEKELVGGIGIDDEEEESNIERRQKSPTSTPIEINITPPSDTSPTNKSLTSKEGGFTMAASLFNSFAEPSPHNLTLHPDLAKSTKGGEKGNRLLVPPSNDYMLPANIYTKQPKRTSGKILSPIPQMKAESEESEKSEESDSIHTPTEENKKKISTFRPNIQTAQEIENLDAEKPKEEVKNDDIAFGILKRQRRNARRKENKTITTSTEFSQEMLNLQTQPIGVKKIDSNSSLMNALIKKQKSDGNFLKLANNTVGLKKIQLEHQPRFQKMSEVTPIPVLFGLRDPTPTNRIPANNKSTNKPEDISPKRNQNQNFRRAITLDTKVFKEENSFQERVKTNKKGSETSLFSLKREEKKLRAEDLSSSSESESESSVGENEGKKGGSETSSHSSSYLSSSEEDKQNKLKQVMVSNLDLPQGMITKPKVSNFQTGEEEEKELVSPSSPMPNKHKSIFTTSGDNLYIQEYQNKENIYKQYTENEHDSDMLGEKKKSKLEELLNKALLDKTEEQKLEKAVEFYKFAVNSQKIRFDFKNPLIKKIFLFQTHVVWTTILTLITWLYLILTFMEPIHSEDRPFKYRSQMYNFLLSTETLIIITYTIDDIMEFTHRFYDNERSKKDHFFKNIKIMAKYLIDSNLVIDYVLFWSFYSANIEYFRYGRVFRAIKLVAISKEMRRITKAICITIPHIIDVIILFVLVTFIFSILGIKILGDVRDEYPSDRFKEENDFSSIGGAMNSLYLLISYSNYPNILTPYVESSPYYFCYFFPYVFIVLIFLVPIPIAVIFDAYRKYRGNIILKDIIREKEAIFPVYSCLADPTDGYVSYEKWINMTEKLYGHREGWKERVEKVFFHYDSDSDLNLTMPEFFDCCSLILCMKELVIAVLCDPKWWRIFREFCNNILKIRTIVESIWFELFILLCVIVNIIILILYATTEDEDKIATLEIIDKVILYIFVLEVILKIIALGVVEYFGDNWNKFDFTLVIVSLVLDASINIMKVAKSAKSAKAAKAARLSRSQRTMKVFKGLRSVRAAKILNASLGTFIRIKNMIQKTILCLPSIQKILTLLVIIFYTYCVVGMEVFSRNEEETYYSAGFYGNFTSFAKALIVHFQILTQSNWHCILFHYARNHGSWNSELYFVSFHLITVLVIISIITGIILEIFLLQTGPDDTSTEGQEGKDQTEIREDGKDSEMDEDRADPGETKTGEEGAENSNNSPPSGKINIFSRRQTRKFNSKIPITPPLGNNTNNTSPIKRRQSESSKLSEENVGTPENEDTGEESPPSIGPSPIKRQSTSVVMPGIAKPNARKKLGRRDSRACILKGELQGLKTPYLLRKALLRETSKEKLKDFEASHLSSTFSAYDDRLKEMSTTKDIEEEEKDEGEKERIQGSIMFYTFKNSDPLISSEEYFTNWLDIYQDMIDILPNGSSVHMAYQLENEKNCLLYLDPNRAISVDFTNMSGPDMGGKSIMTYNILDYLKQESEINNVEGGGFRLFGGVGIAAIARTELFNSMTIIQDEQGFESPQIKEFKNYSCSQKEINGNQEKLQNDRRQPSISCTEISQMDATTDAALLPEESKESVVNIEEFSASSMIKLNKRKVSTNINQDENQKTEDGIIMQKVYLFCLIPRSKKLSVEKSSSRFSINRARLSVMAGLGNKTEDNSNSIDNEKMEEIMKFLRYYEIILDKYKEDVFKRIREWTESGRMRRFQVKEKNINGRMQPFLLPLIT